MDDPKSQDPKRIDSESDRLKPASLKAAVWRARVENAQRSEAVDDLRQAELARLGVLFEAIRPVIGQTPTDVDLFDPGIAFGDRPRLFLDAIAFVDMGHDRRTYRFFQDTRYGRVLIAETPEIDAVVTAMTNYIARRLVERERALATDACPRSPELKPAKPPVRAVRKPSRLWGIAGDAVSFLLMSVGAVTLLGLLALAVWQAWTTWGQALWIAQFGSAPF